MEVYFLSNYSLFRYVSFVNITSFIKNWCDFAQKNNFENVLIFYYWKYSDWLAQSNNHGGLHNDRVMTDHTKYFMIETFCQSKPIYDISCFNTLDFLSVTPSVCVREFIDCATNWSQLILWVTNCCWDYHFLSSSCPKLYH